MQVAFVDGDKLIRKAAFGPRRSLRVAVVDRDKNTHLAVAEALQAKDPECVLDSYQNLTQAIHGLRASRPDVALVAMDERCHFGVSTVRKLKLSWPHLPIIALVSRADTCLIVAPLMAGASGCLMKPVAPDELHRAVTDAAGGWPPLCREARRALVAWLHLACAKNGLDTLSPQEDQVLACLVERLSDKAIAHRLSLELGAVRTLLKRLFQKLEVHTRGDAVRKASHLRARA
jgi:DNA-binding NarL/FixJ family response regulator